MKGPKLSIENYTGLLPVLLNSKTRITLSYGGAGSSKSYSQAQCEIYKAINEKHRTVVLRKVNRTLKDSCIRLIKDDLLAPSGYPFEYKKQDQELYVGESMIAFRGLDDPEKIKSFAGITRIWIEEATEFTIKDWRQLLLRLRDSDECQIVATFNPIDKNHWLKEVSEQPGVTVVHSTFKNNPYLPQSYIDELQSYITLDPYTYDVYVNGEWGVERVDNPFATSFDEKRHLGKVEYQQGVPLRVSMDFNVEPYAVVLYQMYKDEKGYHFHVFKEFSYDSGSLYKFTDDLKRLFPTQIPMVQLTGDATGRKREFTQRDNASVWELIRRELRLNNRQLKIPKVNPTHKNSRTQFNYVLYHFEDFKINPVECPNLVTDLRSVEVKPDGQINKKDRNKTEQKADFLDAIRYAVNTDLGKWVVEHQSRRR